MAINRIRPLAGFFLAITVGFLAGCQNPGKAEKPGENALYGEQAPPQPLQSTSANPSSGDVAGFLRTGYEPLETWMDTRFKVRYENMPLTMVFDQQPISEIRYQLVSLPPNPPVFHLVSNSISRRQILKEIADYFGLDMEVEMVNGQPGVVLVRGRSGSSGATSSAPLSPTGGPQPIYGPPPGVEPVPSMTPPNPQERVVIPSMTTPRI